MGEEAWPENVVRSKGSYYPSYRRRFRVRGQLVDLGRVIADGPRPIVCADCGTPIHDGLVVHMKPETYAVWYKDERFYLERHIGVACGCAKKRGLA